MSPLGWLLLAAAVFVSSHLALSHPLRQPLVDRLGEKRFPAVYVPVALVTFGLMVAAAVWTPQEQPLWAAGDGLWMLMWFGSILFIGSFQRNPAFPSRSGEPIRKIGEARGVFAITRHPMNWGFAIWGIVHMAVVATPSAIVVGGAFLFLAIVGSIGQDAKKSQLIGSPWDDWVRRTCSSRSGAGLPGRAVSQRSEEPACFWLQPGCTNSSRPFPPEFGDGSAKAAALKLTDGS